MKNIVLTFDDCYDSHLLFVKPLLEFLGFSATFFVSGYYLGTCKIFKREHLKAFENNGFELGNHLFSHVHMTETSEEINKREIEHLNQIFQGLHLQKPTSFAYPAYFINDEAKEIIRQAGFQYARAGAGDPFNPEIHDPLDIKCTGIFSNTYRFGDFLSDLEKVKKDEYGVFCIHDVVKDLSENPHETTTTCATFMKCMMHLHLNDYKVMALKDINGSTNR